MLHTPHVLNGARIWLSGAIPEQTDESQKAAIRLFVQRFAEQVFRGGGHILHGAHPTFVPTLIDEAKKHVANGGRKDCLTLIVSRYWSKTDRDSTVHAWRQACMVYETPEATSGTSIRDDSLAVLREWMADRCDAFVAVGGEWWREVAGRQGVPIEVGLAMGRGLPCFLLGGFGGAADEYIENHPEIIGSLRNGFDDNRNKEFARKKNIVDIVDVVCEQLTRLPLVRGRASDGISFRILALDGGGIKGAFTASVLATLESFLGMNANRCFDLIAGTSTGGILAVGMGMGLSAAGMLEFYRDRGPVVFPIMRLHKRYLSNFRHMFRPKYSQTILRREIDSAYFSDGGPKSLGDSICRLVIPAYDAVSGICHVFRTPHHPLLAADASTNAAEVAVATAAAPTYFPSAAVRNLVARASFFDGGVWANCPAMAAIIEAVCYLNVPLDRIDVLSIGTTDEPFTVKSMAKAGWVRWLKTLIGLLMNAQLESSVRHAQQLVGEPRFLRLNVTTVPKMYAMDGTKEIESLIALGNRKASEIEVLSQVKSRFMNGIEAMDWHQGA